ncbi:MAG: DegT/DnrJ/EryC1/StrS family aminotransferase [Vicinamibacterales bacterium]
MLAAYLLAQLESHERIQQRRMAIWQRYAEALADWAAAHGVQLPAVPDGCTHPAHIFHLLMPSLEARTALLAHLRQRLILAVFHYQPLHLSEMGRRLGGREGQCPVTEQVCDRLVRLPIFFQLQDEDQARIIQSVTGAALP